MVENELLLRKVKRIFIRPDNTITNEAYRPRKKETEPSGFERNVSAALKSYYDTHEKLTDFNFPKTVIYEINSSCPNEKGYPCINDHDCHVGITGNMKKLFEDFETLEYLAVNSNILFPI